MHAEVLPPLTCHTVLRDVVIEGHRLITWETGRRDSFGRTFLAYRLIDPLGSTVFEGQDFSPGAATCIDSDEAVRGILGFLTLRPGEVESDYFDDYTPAQLEWRDEHAESLHLYALDPEDFDSDDAPHEFTEYQRAYLPGYPDDERNA